MATPQETIIVIEYEKGNTTEEELLEEIKNLKGVTYANFYYADD